MRQLATWKIKSLLNATKVLLIQTTLMSLPMHVMQVVEVPRKVVDEFKKMSRRFLWGDTEGVRRMHMMKWERICILKSEGGLSISNLQQVNTTFSAKLGWRWLNFPWSLTSIIMQSKYEAGVT